VSDRHIEKEPFFTNFPMYAYTYASPRAYDEQHRTFTSVRFYRYEPAVAPSVLLSPPNEVFPIRGTDDFQTTFARGTEIPVVELARRWAVVKVFQKLRSDDQIDAKVRQAFSQATVKPRTA